MKWFLGVDGGQSGTSALIGDAAGNVVGSGEAGPCNHAAGAEGRARLERGVSESVAAACRDAGIDAAAVQFEAACFGMSGGPEDKRAIVTGLVSAKHWAFSHDAAVALAGAMAGGPGIVVIAGTGSIAYGRNDGGEAARAGGWGYIFGDEGGAFDIARHALRAALRMEEGWGPPTTLREALLAATGAPSANDVLHLFYGPDWPRSRVATLAPLVDRAAAESDAAASGILHRAAQELAQLAAAVRVQLWPSGGAVEIACVGGVFQSVAVRERFRLLAESSDGCRVVPARYGPAEGALLEAYRTAGVRVALHRAAAREV